MAPDLCVDDEIKEKIDSSKLTEDKKVIEENKSTVCDCYL
jgi:hypothetical protein